MNNLKKEKMEGQVLVETYPKAASIIKDSIINNIKKSMRINDDQLGRDFIKDIIDNQIDGLLIDMIENSPHSLFDIFDNNNIYIYIVVRNNKNGVLFNYRIVPRDKKNSSRSSKDRKTIEYYAIEDAFETLNNQL
jgi:predicted  nucleic acid-binding Zn ribbon protein